MSIRLLLPFLLTFLPFYTFSQSLDRYALIPRPAQLEPRAGTFTVHSGTTILVPSDQPALKDLAGLFVDQLTRSHGLAIPVTDVRSVLLPEPTGGQNQIQFTRTTDSTLGPEGYRMEVAEKRIRIESAYDAGFFYALQTLLQLLPPTVLRQEQPLIPSGLTQLNVPACRIEDRPRYPYRGMHLDVSRHFFPVSFIKKFLDLMALHKFNRFHWHLTDDQGWRIESKKYPELTRQGALRRETIVGHYDEFDPQVFDGQPYGGFYTQDDIREVVRYAAARHITIVPEIEMPGHALAALATYPSLACSPGPYPVATKWGVFEDVFCPTEKTFSFLEDVLTEVMDLFPGQYIHIGGDECPKKVWRNSPFCQQLMKRNRLKNANELQSYFIARIDKFVTAHGRRIIGWDEILEGNSLATRLSSKAAVMSWRGTKGGILAAQKHHDVIMTPDKFCYFNYYQGNPAQEPTAFGGYLPLDKVYAYDPTPASLLPAEANHILGAQGNVWTEYIATPDQAEYMIWPRAAALAEVVWTPAAKKNYADFSRRLPTHFERLTSLHVNFARTFFDAQSSGQATADGQVEITLSAPRQVPEIRYTLDGSIPSGESPLYKKPFSLSRSAIIRTASFRQGQPLSELAKVQTEYILSKATGKAYTYLIAPGSSRPDRNYSLTDGTTGGMGGYEVAGVVSFKSDLAVVIDLGQSAPVESVQIGFLKYTARNICLPRQVIIAVSEDGNVFNTVLTANTNAAERGKRAFVRLPFAFTPTTARYIRITARNVGRVPAGLRNPGRAAQLAVDEIEVR